MERKNYNRVDRVSQQIHEILAQLLLREVRDSDLQNVNITAVEVSGDFQVATVYYVMIADDPRPTPRVVKGLNRALGFLRKKLGEGLTMRHTPELRFKYDEASSRGRRIEELLRSIEIPEAPEDEEE